MAVLTVIILLLLPPMIQELIHLFVPVVVCIRVSRYDADYGVSLTLPQYTNENTIFCL